MRHNEIKKKVNEGGLADMAQRVEQDHEVQMARSDLYKLAKYSIKLHNMLAMIPETKGIEGWQQAKITKAADYISSVYHNLDYEMKFDQQQVAEKKKSSYKDGLSAMLESKKKSSKVKEENNILDPLRGAAAELFGEPEVSSIPPEETAILQAMEKYKDDPAGFKDWIWKDQDLRDWLAADGNYLVDMVKSHIKGKPKTESKDELCKECGNPSWRTLDEEKQKGVDGKVCWKGYKRMGTKKKNGKTVDNCVKVD